MVNLRLVTNSPEVSEIAETYTIGLKFQHAEVCPFLFNLIKHLKSF